MIAQVVFFSAIDFFTLVLLFGCVTVAVTVAVVAVAVAVVAVVVAVVFVAIGPTVPVVVAALLTVSSEEGFETVFVKKFTCGAFGFFLIVVAQVSLVDRQHRDVFLCQVARGGHVSQGFWCRRGVGRGDAKWCLGCCAIGVGW